jgi:hypothetical protein
MNVALTLLVFAFFFHSGMSCIRRLLTTTAELARRLASLAHNVAKRQACR